VSKSVLIPFRIAALAALGVAATAASAQPLVTARVLAAQPVVQQVPVADCAPYGAPPTGAGAAVGALTGGLIGSQMGRGNGHIAGAMLGAIGGAIVGNAAEASQQRQASGCATRYSQQVIGYDVTYEYAGRQYVTRTGRPPGQWLQVPDPGVDSGAYPDQQQPVYGGAQQVNPPPQADDDAYPPPEPAYPAAGTPPQVVTAPPRAYQQAYPQPYPPPGYGYPVQAAPVYAPPAPVYAAPPVGVGLSVGGRVGRHGSVGVGVGF